MKIEEIFVNFLKRIGSIMMISIGSWQLLTDQSIAKVIVAFAIGGTLIWWEINDR